MGITSNKMLHMSLKEKIRFYLWRILGIDYSHVLKVVDDVYLKEDIYIIQYPNGNELCLAQGEIHSIINYNIKHIDSTFFGSSGSPI